MDSQQLLRQSVITLRTNLVKNFMLDSELILAKTLNTTREDLLMNMDKKLTKSQIEKFNNLIFQRINKKPMAYILGYKEFWKNNFKVNSDVLIPRPDTELIVEEALFILKKNKSYKVLDIGTGSGCIILSILKERQKCVGFGIDVSFKAIKIAKLNAKLQHLNNRAIFIKSDIDNYNTSNYDVIVSNPPYIKKFKIKSLDEDVKNFEPKIALDGGPDGCSLIEKVVVKSSRLIKKRGKFILEIDTKQAHNVKKILEKNEFYINKVSKDLSGKYRCIVSTKI